MRPDFDATITVRRCNKAWRESSSNTPRSESTYPLCEDLLHRAARRLGLVGLIYAVSFLVFHIVWSLAMVGHGSLLRFTFADLVATLAVISGAAMFGLSRWSRWPDRRVIAFGVFFQIFGAFLISLVETSLPFQPGDIIRGHSAIAIWIVYFVLLVPIKWESMVAAALASAAMGPAGMLFNIWFNGVAPPTTAQWVLLNAAPFLIVAATAPIARYIYSLGAQVSKARETGSYELIERIGQGGMGEVWRARHRMLARPAAVKLIRPATLESESGMDAVRRRFEREAKATAALQSPHTVTLYDYGMTDDGAMYYAMELVNGMDLEVLVRRHGPQPPERVIHILTQVCDSLAEAHAHGLTHRDVKPRNILVGRLGLEYDFVKVVDFGLVKMLKAKPDIQLTQDGATTGTPAYMAPEIVMGEVEPDERADIYALGCVGYWLLAGRPVFEGKTATAMALHHVQTQPEPPSRHVETPVPADLERIILSCLAKKPEQRPQSAVELKALLRSSLPEAEWNFGSAEDWWQIHQPEVVASVHAEPVLA